MQPLDIKCSMLSQCMFNAYIHSTSHSDMRIVVQHPTSKI